MGSKGSKRAKAANNDAGVAMQPQNVQREEDKMRIAELEARVTELEIEIKALEGKKDKGEGNNNNGEVETLKAELERAQRKLEDIKAEYEEALSKTTADLQKANADLSSLRKKPKNVGVKDSSSGNLGQLDDKTKQLENDLKQSKANEGKLKDEIINLRQRIQSGSSDNGDAEAELAKVKKQLEEEKELNAGLRKELNIRTKESLANLSKPSTQTSAPVVLSEAAEYMKMNEVELRSKIALVDHDLELSQEKVGMLEAEVERLTKANQALSTKMMGKDKTIGDLTLQVHEAQADKVGSQVSGLDSKLDGLEDKHNKFDADIEMMEENLKLQMLLEEKEEIIKKLQEANK